MSLLCVFLSAVEAWSLRVHTCITGPSPNTPAMVVYCGAVDFDVDGDVDLRDVARWMNNLVKP